MRILVSLLIAASFSSATFAHPVPLSIGDTHVVEAMDEEREINVLLPLSYEPDAERRYPVVYMLDGGVSQDLMMQVDVARWTQMWGRTEDFILVGIETKHRQRELLTPTTDEKALEFYPNAGESEIFRDYVRDTVKPLIEKAYRTDGRDFLVGESAAGHFVVETLLREPDLFTGYAAISPSLWWEGQELATEAETLGAGAAPLFLSIANEGETMPEMDEGVRRVMAVRATSEAATCFVDRSDLTHGVAYHALLPSALQYFIPGEKELPAEWGMVTGCVD